MTGWIIIEEFMGRGYAVQATATVSESSLYFWLSIKKMSQILKTEKDKKFQTQLKWI